MPCEERWDNGGHHWRVPGDNNHARVDVWWNRSDMMWDGHSKAEHLILRQENVHEGDADVVILRLSMVYDLIDALNKAVEKP